MPHSPDSGSYRDNTRYFNTRNFRVNRVLVDPALGPGSLSLLPAVGITHHTSGLYVPQDCAHRITLPREHHFFAFFESLHKHYFRHEAFPVYCI